MHQDRNDLDGPISISGVASQNTSVVQLGSDFSFGTSSFKDVRTGEISRF